MKRYTAYLLTVLFLCFTFISSLQAQNSIPSRKQQIKAALATAPKKLQSGAKVYGYTQQGKWTTLREGTNKLICIADDPSTPNFHVACYYKALEPFMKRGRELRAKGYPPQKVNKIRRREIKSGKLPVPDKPMALYSLTGSKNAYNYETTTLIKARPLYVVYVPFATQKMTGLPMKPAGPGAPWLMEAGLPWAHIMISNEPVGKATKE